MLVEEFRDYLKANKFVEHQTHSSHVHQEAHEVPTEWERSVESFFTFWNGGLRRDDEYLLHYCSGLGCFQSRAVTHAKAQYTLLWLLCDKPCTPVVSRWAKVGPCLDLWLHGQVFCLLRGLLQLATEALRFNDAADATARPAEDRCVFDANKYTGVAAAAKEDFLAAAGRRLKRTQ